MGNETAVATIQQQEIANNFLPVFTTETALQRYQAFKDFVKGVLREGVDFGKIPGSEKDTLLKPGAEKLCTFFGLTPKYVLEVVEEDWLGERHKGEPFFYYRIRCQLFRGDAQMGEGIGSCSSWEAKYRYRWVDENTVNRMGIDKSTLVSRGGAMSEFEFAIEKAQTSGQYGKPAEYWAKWKQAIADGKARKINKQKKDGTASPAYEMDMAMYRVSNAEFADIVNTVQKIGLKRSYIAACLSATNASDYFTQDLEDYIDVDAIPTGGHPVGTQAAADYVRDQKLQQLRNEQHEVDVRQTRVSAQLPPPSTIQEAEVIELEPQHKPQPVTATTNRTNAVIPEGLQRLWGQMFKPEQRLQVIEQMRLNMMSAFGEEEGRRKFYEVLNSYNAKEPQDFARNLEDARRAVRDMYRLVEPILLKDKVA